MKKKIISLLIIFAGISILDSCTKLDEEVLDESSSTGKTDKEIADGLIAPVYARLPDIYRHTTYFALQEISTDEAILPYRGGTDWGDNGIYIALHKHETTSTDPNVRDTWNLIVEGISRSITALSSLAGNTDANVPAYVAEARGMRAFYNLLSLDLFGISFVKESPGEVSTIIRGTEAIEYIKSELLAVEPLLDNANG